MKLPFTTLVALLGLLGSTTAQAQTLPSLPNAGFEIWTLSVPGGPSAWTSSDQSYDQLSLTLSGSTVEPTAAAHSGNFAALLRARTAAGGPLLGPHLVLGSYNPTNPITRPGMALSGWPAALHFWYQYTGTSADTTEAKVELWQGQGLVRQRVGSGRLRLTPAPGSAGYQLGEVVLHYVASTAAPDWVQVSFRGSATSTGLFYLDDVSLDASIRTGSREPAARGMFSVVPNPSADGLFRLLAPLHPQVAAAAYTITDLTGRVVLRAPALAPVAERTLDLRGLPAGVYTLHLHAEQGVLTQRLVLR